MFQIQDLIAMKRTRKVYLLVFAAFLIGYCSYAQKRPATYKMDLKEAERLFIEEQYEEALPLYLALDSFPPREPKITYAIGIIYANKKEKTEQLKGIPYLEYAVQNDKDKKIPDNAYYHLGLLYHKNQDTKKALVAFKKVVESKNTLPNYKKVAREYIEMNE
jgi:tetratricopeptide (TPR) repeat protein